MIRSASIAIIVLLTISRVWLHDSGQWNQLEDQDTINWYRALMQPDVPHASCCGEADAWYCDDVYSKHSSLDNQVKTYCRITDDRPDAPRNRIHIDVGTEFEIPVSKLEQYKSNPTGHSIIFLSRAMYVYCFIMSTGI